MSSTTLFRCARCDRRGQRQSPLIAQVDRVGKTDKGAVVIYGHRQHNNLAKQDRYTTPSRSFAHAMVDHLHGTIPPGGYVESAAIVPAMRPGRQPRVRGELLVDGARHIVQCPGCRCQIQVTARMLRRRANGGVQFL